MRNAMKSLGQLQTRESGEWSRKRGRPWNQHLCPSLGDEAALTCKILTHTKKEPMMLLSWNTVIKGYTDSYSAENIKVIRSLKNPLFFRAGKKGAIKAGLLLLSVACCWLSLLLLLKWHKNVSKQEKTKKDRKKTNQATASRLSVGRGGAVREKNKNRLQEHFYNSSKHRCDSSKVMRVGFSLPTVSTATILQPPDVYGLIHRSCSNKRWGRREGARRHVPAAEDNHLNAASIHNTGIISLYGKK